MKANSKVETFFDSYAIDFDSIYGEGKKDHLLLKSLINCSDNQCITDTNYQLILN